MRIVEKYGGTSVATTEQLELIAEHLRDLHQQGFQIVVVVSAMGKSTNELINIANEICSFPAKREMDQLLSTGEIKTISLLSIALQKIGVSSISFTGAQAGIVTNQTYSRAFIEDIDTTNIISALNNGYVVVVAGFQGISKNGNITTLGRGGSDITAVALSSKLQCPCIIYTDVEAVHCIDPKLVPKSIKLHKICYDEMIEMAINGAKVLDTRCVELASKYSIPLFLGKSLETNLQKGTYVMQKFNSIEQMPIKSISIKNNLSIITVKLTKNQYHSCWQILEIIDENTLSLDMLTTQTMENELIVSFNCPSENVNILTQSISKNMPTCSIQVENNKSKVTLIGIGIATHLDLASSALKALNQNDIPYYKINNTDISMGIMIDESLAEKTVNILSNEFNLLEKQNENN